MAKSVGLAACRALFLLGGVPFGVSTAGAQTNPAGDQSALIQKMMERIDRLEKRVNELEAEKRAAVSAPAPSAVTATAPLPASPEEKAAVPAEAAVATMQGMPYHIMGSDNVSYPALHIAGFGDINFAADDRKGAVSGFNEGQFILHLSSALSSRVNFFGEISLTARADGGQGLPSAPGFNVEVERSIIRFEENDHLKVSFGRYHTAINYWNTQFHHGSWLQTTIARPQMVEFGGSFLPVHFVGALAEGTFALEGLNLHYSSGVGNGRGAVISRGGDFGDINNSRAWLANAYFQPDRFYGLKIGGSVYRDKINPLTGIPSREWIESAHVVWEKENPEFIAEFSNVTHKTIGVGPTLIGSGQVYNSQAWYVQAAYRLPFWERLWKPYFRYEYIHIPKGDTIFTLVPNLAQSTAGIRYDLSSFAALKLEYRNQHTTGIAHGNGIFAQTSFTF